MKRLSEFVLLAAGLALIVVGVRLMFDHQEAEVAFQQNLLEVFEKDYHWRSIGDANFGVSAIVVGALMVTVSATLEAVMRWMEGVSSRYPRG
jgi:ABC-type phosphate transport system permease subunit